MLFFVAIDNNFKQFLTQDLFFKRYLDEIDLYMFPAKIAFEKTICTIHRKTALFLKSLRGLGYSLLLNFHANTQRWKIAISCPV